VCMSLSVCMSLNASIGVFKGPCSVFRVSSVCGLACGPMQSLVSYLGSLVSLVCVAPCL
jgi:hypothetical protein